MLPFLPAHLDFISLDQGIPLSSSSCCYLCPSNSGGSAASVLAQDWVPGPRAPQNRMSSSPYLPAPYDKWKNAMLLAVCGSLGPRVLGERERARPGGSKRSLLERVVCHLSLPRACILPWPSSTCWAVPWCLTFWPPLVKAPSGRSPGFSREGPWWGRSPYVWLSCPMRGWLLLCQPWIPSGSFVVSKVFIKPLLCGRHWG